MASPILLTASNYDNITISDNASILTCSDYAPIAMPATPAQLTDLPFLTSQAVAFWTASTAQQRAALKLPYQLRCLGCGGGMDQSAWVLVLNCLPMHRHCVRQLQAKDLLFGTVDFALYRQYMQDHVHTRDARQQAPDFLLCDEVLSASEDEGD